MSCANIAFYVIILNQKILDRFYGNNDHSQNVKEQNENRRKEKSQIWFINLCRFVDISLNIIQKQNLQRFNFCIIACCFANST